MTKYLLDTNIWVEIGRGTIDFVELEKVRVHKGVSFLWAPPVLTELFGGTIQGGIAHFKKNQRIFECSRQLDNSVLELPSPFIWKRLWNTSRQKSTVHPEHYFDLIEMCIRSRDFADFLQRTR